MSEAVSKLSLEAKIKLKYKEWEVEITCVEDKVKNVVENVLTGIDIASLSSTNTNSEIEKLKTEIDLLKSRIDFGVKANIIISIGDLFNRFPNILNEKTKDIFMLLHDH